MHSCAFCSNAWESKRTERTNFALIRTNRTNRTNRVRHVITFVRKLVRWNCLYFSWLQGCARMHEFFPTFTPSHPRKGFYPVLC